MRLLYITSTLPFGPGEVFLYPEIEELQRRGVEVRVVPMYPRGPLVHPEAHSVLNQTVSEPLISWRVLRGALEMLLRSPLKALGALRLLLTPNLRHLLKNLAVYPKGLWLGKLAREWRADHIHVHWAATTASMAMVASAVSGVPWSLTAHRWDIVENNLLRKKAEQACFFRCISEKTKAMALERGVPPEKALILHLGIRLPEAPVVDRPPGERKGFVVLCPAAFIERKGHRYLVEALRILPDPIALWLAGEGELKAEIQERVARLGLEGRVRFLGFLSHEELLSLYRERRVDLVALSSVDLGDGLNEGIPVALMEAMSYGIPVVSTRTGGIPELLRDGAGVLVPDKDPGALAEAIHAFYLNPAYAEAVGRQGRRRVEEEFSAQQVVGKLLALWERCT
ncbi:glycosyltransferase family 4 protein [Thermus filiformis]|uniref:Glycosyl transferase family 1 n=1 Tax=Thermus filiformis TaxID=276 RepID=A0A0D6XAT6_THEFI|nr:glycosyltransferase family 4 protein [Thermus filiformis]KIX84466.1 hypothetical protein THFILI_05725 [Thermus filiformis]